MEGIKLERKHILGMVFTLIASFRESIRVISSLPTRLVRTKVSSSHFALRQSCLNDFENCFMHGKSCRISVLKLCPLGVFRAFNATIHTVDSSTTFSISPLPHLTCSLHWFLSIMDEWDPQQHRPLLLCECLYVCLIIISINQSKSQRALQDPRRPEGNLNSIDKSTLVESKSARKVNWINWKWTKLSSVQVEWLIEMARIGQIKFT